MAASGHKQPLRASAVDVRFGVHFRHGRLLTDFEAGLREIFRVEIEVGQNGRPLSFHSACG